MNLQVTLTEFLLARIAEDEQPTWTITPYDCAPGCCAPEGWVGSQCRYCDHAPVYGGTVEAITAMAEEHAERIHQRARVLAECEAKRDMVQLLSVDARDPKNALRRTWAIEVLGKFASAYADHPDYRAAAQRGGWGPCPRFIATCDRCGLVGGPYEEPVNAEATAERHYVASGHDAGVEVDE